MSVLSIGILNIIKLLGIIETQIKDNLPPKLHKVIRYEKSLLELKTVISIICQTSKLELFAQRSSIIDVWQSLTYVCFYFDFIAF